MAHYNFKNIVVVPTSKEFNDIVLSKKRRKTPTVIHKQYKISRIRAFYMRKVKYTQTNFHDKLTRILTDFPKLEDIHLFFADISNVLYDRYHNNIALGQLNTARHLIDNVAKEYCRLLKYGDTLYRCKLLKKAALGRLWLSSSQNLSDRSLQLGHCGKRSISILTVSITRADVEVQSWAFTTKSLYVGHTDYKYLKWQVIDTPGILDHPIEDRNTIEMLAITALAHLRACVIFVLDPSEQCNYSVDEQKNIQFTCERLLAHRVEIKLKGKKAAAVLNRLEVAEPQPRDDKQRLPFIPEKVFEKKQQMQADSIKRKLKIMSFVTKKKLKKLDELDKEEELREAAGFYDESESEDDEGKRNIRMLARKIREKKKLKRMERDRIKSISKPILPRTAKKRVRSVSRLRSEFGELGVELDSDNEAHYKDAVSGRAVRSVKRKGCFFRDKLVALHFKYDFWHRTATAGSDVVQSGRPIFDDFFQHLSSYVDNNTANVVFQMVKRLWLIRIDQ
ncbi:nucleolar GTP-binding protein 1 [Trichonephila clavipes]|nr:nucleolar GTP-binding protein 1 [Trichonephila clavipes]